MCTTNKPHLDEGVLIVNRFFIGHSAMGAVEDNCIPPHSVFRFQQQFAFKFSLKLQQFRGKIVCVFKYNNGF